MTHRYGPAVKYKEKQFKLDLYDYIIMKLSKSQINHKITSVIFVFVHYKNTNLR